MGKETKEKKLKKKTLTKFISIVVLLPSRKKVDTIDNIKHQPSYSTKKIAFMIENERRKFKTMTKFNSLYSCLTAVKEESRCQ